MNRAFERFKALADKKKSVYDEDLIALVAQESTRGVRDRYELVYLNVTSSSMAVPHATVKLRIDGEERVGHGDRRRHGRRLLQGDQRARPACTRSSTATP